MRHSRIRKVTAVILSAALATAALAGCSKKEEAMDQTKALLTLGDDSISIGAANTFFRYQQAEFENGFGSFIKSYYGDIWNSDLTGTGQAYGDVFKAQILEQLQHMLLAKGHAADYSVELTDEEKSAIKTAAADFVAANGEEVLTKMGATEESVEEMLTYYTIESKMEEAMSADVDTEVSDEEAAQRTVSYIYFTAETEAETEEETEIETGDVEESMSESVAEVAELEEESEVKTGASDSETELSEEDLEQTSEAAEESVAEEASTEDTTEAEEVETESPEMQQARAEALGRANAFLALAATADDFSAAASEAAADESAHASASSFTFGDDDTYPDAAIIEATKGLEDGALVDEVIVVGNNYYVLHVDDAFDEEATATRKEEIVEERKQEAISSLYETWDGEASFEFDSETWAALVFDMALNFEQETEDMEAVSEAVSEAAEEMTEGLSVQESATE